MITSVWRIAVDAPEYTADDMTGAGARLTGGRWNRAGTPVVYTASSIALACLETLVHINAGGLPLNRYLVRYDIPGDVFAAATIATNPPVGWDALPAGRVSLDLGEAWAGEGATALLIVPSIMVPEETNILINPAHADAARIRASKLRKFVYDGRLRDGTARART